MQIKREDLNYLLQKADIAELKKLYELIAQKHTITILQQPTQQTLLQPVFDPISQGSFYAGEILVTMTMVQIDKTSHKGWAMVQDDHEALSLYIAVCDGCFGANLFKEEIKLLALHSQQTIEKYQEKINQKVHATKVNFDLMT